MADHAHTDVMTRAELQPLRLATTGTTAEALGGVAAIVLAILGLAGLVPIYLAAIAAIAMGVSLLFEGGVISARLVDLLEEVGGGALDAEELGGGLTAEFVGGATGVILGILALLDLAPEVLVPAAIIVFGATLLLSGGGARRIGSVSTRRDVSDEVRMIAWQVARRARAEAAGAQVLIGLGAAVLGILALVGFDPATLSLVAFLALGAAVLMSGTAVASRWHTVVRNEQPEH